MSSPLASLLVQEGLVTANRMAEAFQRQVIYGGTLDTILLEMDAVDEGALLDALSRSTAMPLASDRLADKSAAQAWMPRALAEEFRVVPLGLDGNRLQVMVLDPPDAAGLDKLRKKLKRDLEPAIGPEHRYARALGTLYGVEVPARFASLAAKLERRAADPTRPKFVARAQPVVVTDVPLASETAAVDDAPAPASHAPVEAAPSEAAESPTSRIRAREEGAPAATVPRERARRLTRLEASAMQPPPRPAPDETAAPSEALDLAAARQALDECEERDRVFELLCRGARSRLGFAAILTVHGETLEGKLALGHGWFDKNALSGVTVPLGEPSPFRAAVVGRAPYLGHIGDDALGTRVLASLGRKPPMPALAMPLVLRERAVALLYADADGHELGADVIAELTTLVAAATRSFQRLILRKKGEGDRAAPERAAAAPSTIHDLATAPLPRVDDLDALVDAVEKNDHDGARAADALVLLGARAADQVLTRLAKSPSARERHAATLAEHGPLGALLGRLANSARAELQARLDDADPEVRYFGTLALGELGDGSVLSPLGARLYDPDANVRSAAVRALGRASDSPERRALVEQLRAELLATTAPRRRYAAEALGLLKDLASVPRLIEMVKHADAAVAAAVKKALVEITQQDFGTSRWRWRGWWEKHSKQRDKR